MAAEKDHVTAERSDGQTGVIVVGSRDYMKAAPMASDLVNSTAAKMAFEKVVYWVVKWVGRRAVYLDIDWGKLLVESTGSSLVCSMVDCWAKKLAGLMAPHLDWMTAA